MAGKYYEILEVSAKRIIKNNDILFIKPKMYAAKGGTDAAKVKSGKKVPLNRRKEVGVLHDCLDVRKMEKVYESMNRKSEKPLLPTNQFAIFTSEKIGLKDDDSPIEMSCGKNGMLKSCMGFTFAVINVVFSSRKERESLYESGFDFSYAGRLLHYVRYKRSASSAREGKCLFILQVLEKEMNQWSSLGISPFSASAVDRSTLVSWEAYRALSLSGIEETTIKLPANSILFLKDTNSTYIDYEDRCISPYNRNGEPRKKSDKTRVMFKNKIWDGESLMDGTVFEEPQAYSDKHMLLLRSRFLKSCAFRTNLRKWFADWFGAEEDKLNEISSKELNWANGFTMAENVGDIKLVMTDSSLKYLKFVEKTVDKDSSEYRRFKKKYAIEDEDHAVFCYCCNQWLKSVSDSKNMIELGIVKTDHPSFDASVKGDRPRVRTSYQMINTLGALIDGAKEETPHQSKEVHELIDAELNMIQACKSSPLAFWEFMESRKKIIQNEEAVKVEDSPLFEEGQEETADEVSLSHFGNIDGKMIQMLIGAGKDEDFQGEAGEPPYSCERFPYYKKYVKKVSSDYTERMRGGRLNIEGCYATLFGNPAELLLSTVVPYNTGEWSESSYVTELLNSFVILLGDEVYTECFRDGEMICGVRSPHITMGNLFLGRNKRMEDSVYERYFELCPEIICMNSIGRPTLQLLNGADFDSDAMLITNDKHIVKIVERQYRYFKIPCHDICEDESGSSKKKSETWMLAALDSIISKNRIGQIVNLSAFFNELFWQKFPVCRGNIHEGIYLPRMRGDQWEESDEIYHLICRLAILSNLEIDKAKRQYKGSIKTEYSDCKRKSMEARIYPENDDKLHAMVDYPKNYKQRIRKYKSPVMLSSKEVEVDLQNACCKARFAVNPLLLDMFKEKEKKEEIYFNAYAGLVQKLGKASGDGDEKTYWEQRKNIKIKKTNYDNLLEKLKEDRDKDNSFQSDSDYEKYCLERSAKILEELTEYLKEKCGGAEKKVNWEISCECELPDFMMETEDKTVINYKPAKEKMQYSLFELIPKAMDDFFFENKPKRRKGKDISIVDMIFPIVKEGCFSDVPTLSKEELKSEARKKIKIKKDAITQKISDVAEEISKMRKRKLITEYAIFEDTVSGLTRKLYQGVCKIINNNELEPKEKKYLLRELLEYADNRIEDGRKLVAELTMKAVCVWYWEEEKIK